MNASGSELIAIVFFTQTRIDGRIAIVASPAGDTMTSVHRYTVGTSGCVCTRLRPTLVNVGGAIYAGPASNARTRESVYPVLAACPVLTR
jgi:hypothetical protein